ncbi:MULTISPECIES: YceK/YidQ family lipoprotein [Providencia]|uniref:YceK/YidQ family lipoprotein n=1 Tax=Providencia TaxID=586 RepID=UPI0008382A32|nr:MULTISPECIES: YceK/YidQ family lipoprotein [Providencia]MBP6121568.1 YceK/YidQ family lipoprotein [Providencia sp.]MDD9339446.1 YceK/YidQ family lipoprotein [Providencia heimbachae]NIH21029.1 YceK/YidQ family lipoprotein [Providencia heimbachae]QCJ68650.1 YceK/YidQ family lipoprotein [Providencia heimbachae]
MPSLIFVRLFAFITPLILSGCSSIMTHAGPSEGYYPGSKNSITMIKNEDTGWVVRPLLAIDLPFSIIMDTLLIPLDYAKSGDDSKLDSPKKRIEDLEEKDKNNHQTSANNLKK